MHCACTWLHGFDSVQCILIGVLECIRHSYVDCDGLILHAVCSSLVLSSPIRMVSCWSSYLLGRRTWSWKESCLNECTCVTTWWCWGALDRCHVGWSPRTPPPSQPFLPTIARHPEGVRHHTRGCDNTTPGTWKTPCNGD